MRMTDTEAASERLESRVRHFIDITNRTIHDGADTTESAMHVAIHLAPKRANRAWLVQILDADNLGSRNAGDISAIVVPSILIGLAMRRVARFDHDRDSITYHRPHLWHEVSGFFEVETISSRIPLGDLFPAIVDRGRIPALKLKKFGVSEHDSKNLRFDPFKKAHLLQVGAQRLSLSFIQTSTRQTRRADIDTEHLHRRFGSSHVPARGELLNGSDGAQLLLSC